MAWGYWSATAVDRGRSPRRNTQCTSMPINAVQQNEPIAPTACYSPCRNSRCNSPSCHPPCTDSQCHCADRGDENSPLPLPCELQTNEAVQSDSSEIEEVNQ